MTADWLRPLYREIKTTVMDGGYVQIDETPVRYLEPGNGKTKQGYLWAVNCPRCAHRSASAIFFEWHASRAASCLEAIVPAGWGGKLQCDGRVEIDNNLVENGIRPTAHGKKNYLFFGEVEAGETSAILYTVIENARRRGLDPQACLRDIPTRLPETKQSEIASITPAAWAKAQKAAAVSAIVRVSA